MEQSHILKNLFIGFEWVTRFAVSNLLTCLGIAPVLFLSFNLLLAQRESQVLTLITTLFFISPFLLFPVLSGIFSVVKSWKEDNRSLCSARLFWKCIKQQYKNSYFLGWIIESIFLICSLVLQFLVIDPAIMWGVLWIIGTLLLLITCFTLISFVDLEATFKEHLFNGWFLTLAFPFTNFLLGVFVQVCIGISIFYAQFLIPFFLFSGLAYIFVTLFEKHFERVMQKKHHIRS